MKRKYTDILYIILKYSDLAKTMGYSKISEILSIGAKI